MFFTFSKKPIPPILSKNKEIEVKNIAMNTNHVKEKPVKMENMFRLAQPTANCSSCNSYR
jgi:hypothetical protein